MASVVAYKIAAQSSKWPMTYRCRSCGTGFMVPPRLVLAAYKGGRLAGVDGRRTLVNFDRTKMIVLHLSPYSSLCPLAKHPLLMRTFWTRAWGRNSQAYSLSDEVAASFCDATYHIIPCIYFAYGSLYPVHTRNGPINHNL